VSFVVNQSGCGFGAIAPPFFLCKARQGYCHQGCRLLASGDAYRPVLFQFVPCALQFHACIGREFPAEPIVDRGKRFDVLALPDLKCSFQILTA
jgi:hypothetical protein